MYIHIYIYIHPTAHPLRSIGFMNAGIADPEVRKKKLNAELLGSASPSELGTYVGYVYTMYKYMMMIHVYLISYDTIYLFIFIYTI